jgi:MYXO-CTERM domain-containing protein
VWPAGQWEAILACVQEVYSPYNIKVVDVRPTSGTYNEALVAGNPTDIGAPADSGGIAQVTDDCTPIASGVAFVFAEVLGEFAAEDANNPVWGACWVIAQESAHTYGLDHEFAFSDGRSACNDPMTYRSDCGGEKFFRNVFASCGEFGPARPKCGFTGHCQPTQNSHQKLLQVFGPGTPTTAPPAVMITSPAPDAMVGDGATVTVSATSVRGVQTVELWLNGFKWTDMPGNRFAAVGQLTTPYALVFPDGVPDSIIDVTVKAFDDLLIETDATVTVTKGAAGGCVTADTCAVGQKCEAGKCFWDPPAGEIGASCDYPQFCISNECEGDPKICTQSCLPNTADACPNNLDCVEQSPGMGVCYTPSSGGGCCSVGSGGSAWAPVGFGLFVLAMLLRRRRR